MLVVWLFKVVFRKLADKVPLISQPCELRCGSSAIIISDVYNKGRFRWCDFCLPLSRATFIARTAHVIEKILNDSHHL